jgi:ABC-2 type transport system ATP-binding protein
VLVRLRGDCLPIPGVQQRIPQNHGWKLVLEPGTTPQDVFKALASGPAVIEKFEIAKPSLDEIFIRVVGGGEIQ